MAGGAKAAGSHNRGARSCLALSLACRQNVARVPLKRVVCLRLNRGDQVSTPQAYIKWMNPFNEHLICPT